MLFELLAVKRARYPDQRQLPREHGGELAVAQPRLLDPGPCRTLVSNTPLYAPTGVKRITPRMPAMSARTRSSPCG